MPPTRFLSIFFALLVSHSALTLADYSQHPQAPAVVATLVEEHGFSPEQANELLSHASTEQKILDSMANAAEKTRTWTAYRDGFLSDWRIKAGRAFLKEHAEVLQRVEQIYGVPKEIVTAIIGVETNYGSYTGKANVLNALATLAFEHPSRSKFFTSELIEYLVLCREQGWAAQDMLGSYAGALGMSQFMPSNYRKLAVDYDQNGTVDLFAVEDAIASVANYFQSHGWAPGEAVAFPATADNQADFSLVDNGIKPTSSIAAVRAAGFKFEYEADADTPARIVRFNDEDGDKLWLCLNNFYVISRYNPRTKYAMAVFLLSEMLTD